MYILHDFVTLHSMLDNFLRVKGYGCRLGVTLCYNISLFKNDAMHAYRKQYIINRVTPSANRDMAVYFLFGLSIRTFEVIIISVSVTCSVSESNFNPIFYLL